MTILQQAITIILCALGTMLTRFLPFLVFNPKKPTPKYIQYLGSALPGAIFGMLVVYCLRNVDVLHFAYGLPELIAIAVTISLHLWKRQMLLSIAGDYKGIGFDVIGLDPIADENLTRHKKLFQNKDIVNIENLKDLDKCGKGLFSFSCFPLKLENCDGSPIRAVAWFED